MPPACIRRVIYLCKAVRLFASAAVVAAMATPVLVHAQVAADGASSTDQIHTAVPSATEARPPQSAGNPPTAPAQGGVLSRMLDYYKLEWGKTGPPADPNAP